MTIRVLQTGLHPERVDFDAPEFKRFEGANRGEAAASQRRQCRDAAGRGLSRRQRPHQER